MGYFKSVRGHLLTTYSMKPSRVQVRSHGQTVRRDATLRTASRRSEMEWRNAFEERELLANESGAV